MAARLLALLVAPPARAGAWQIVSLNSADEPAAGDAQLRWFDRATRGGGTCRLAFPDGRGLDRGRVPCRP